MALSLCGRRVSAAREARSNAASTAEVTRWLSAVGVGLAAALFVATVVGLVAPLVVEQVALCSSMTKLLAPPLLRGAGAGGLGEPALALSMSAADLEVAAASTATAFRRLFVGGGSSKAAWTGGSHSAIGR